MIDSAPLLVTSILLAIIHYFENSYRSEFSETYNRLQDADEKIMSRVLSNRSLNKEALDKDIRTPRDSLFTRSFQPLPMWHKAGLFGTLIVLTVALGVLEALDMLVKVPDEVGRVFLVLTYGWLATVAGFSGRGIAKIASKVAEFSREVHELTGKATTAHRAVGGLTDSRDATSPPATT